jgi:hypothetical protein
MAPVGCRLSGERRGDAAKVGTARGQLNVWRWRAGRPGAARGGGRRRTEARNTRGGSGAVGLEEEERRERRRRKENEKKKGKGKREKERKKRKRR